MHLARPHRPPTSPPRRRVTGSLLAGLTVAASLTAATLAPSATASPAAPASSAPPSALGPEVIRTDQPPTGYAVKFRYQAPENVEQVHIYGDWWYAQPDVVDSSRPPSEWQPGDKATTPWYTQPMEQGPDGVWEITVPLPAGSFRYAFTHDCDNELAEGCELHYDPANPWELQESYPDAPGAVRSTIFVPENKKFPTYDTDYQRPVKASKAGTLEMRRYPSPLSTNPIGEHDVVVYLPHGYDPNRPKPYPTFYLSHGGGDNSIAWTMQGVAHHILQNAINEGAVQPMVIVNTDFNFLPNGNQGYADELRDNVIPFVEQNYNVSTRSEDRAFAGFSAGGARAFTIMNDNTELFGYHAAWSAGSGTAPTEEQIERMKNVPGVIFFGTGLQDGSTADSLHQRAELLRAAGVKVAEHYLDGMHTWHVWRPLMNHYIRELAFRETTTGLEVDTKPAGPAGDVRLTAVATVDPVTTSVVGPKGKVTFSAGDHELGSAPVHNGVARFDKVVDGDLLDEPVVAHYQGDRLFNASQSAAVAAD